MAKGKAIARKGAKGRPGARTQADLDRVFADGTKPGEVLEYNWGEDEDGKPIVVGRLVRTVIGGAIWQGRCKNPVPGPGRPPNEVRDQARNSFAERISRLEAIIDDPATPARDVTAAMALLAKLGVASQVEHKGDRPGSPVIILPAQQAPQVLMGHPVEDADAEVEEPLPQAPARATGDDQGVL